MGNKISAVHGVKSDHFYDQGNAINEIWVGDVEVISRLPFGDSDLEQAGWPPGGFPKIPWHHFIIPMHKRDQNVIVNIDSPAPLPTIANGNYGTCEDWVPNYGWLSMYTGISKDLAGNVGVLFSIFALGMFVTYVWICWGAVTKWVAMRNTSVVASNSVDLCRARRAFRLDLARAFSALALCILCLVLGIPGIAAGAKGMDARTFILVNGIFLCCSVFFCGFFVGPLYMFGYARSQRVSTTPMISN